MKTLMTIASTPMLLFVCAGISLTNAATHYVTPDGNASWQQSTGIIQPCSWQTAVNNAMAGDTTYFRAGTYNPPFVYGSTTSMNPKNSGTAGKPIVFKAYPGETPVVVGRNGIGAGFPNGPHHIVWDGFTCKRNEPGYTVHICCPGNITIKNCIIEGTTGINISDNQAGIFVNGGDSVLIENCTISNVDDYPGHHALGILSYHTKNLTIRNNEIHNCNGGILLKDDAKNSRVYNNYVHHTRGSGINIGSYQKGPDPEDNWIYQNVVLTGGINIPNANHVARRSKLFNNVIGGGISLSTYSCRDTEIYNNIHVNGGPANSPTTEGYSYADYNCFPAYGGPLLPNWRDRTGYEMNSINADPEFVNPAGTEPEDYRLRPTSPCMGAGRDGAIIGAFVADKQVIGITDGSISAIVVSPVTHAADGRTISRSSAVTYLFDIQGRRLTGVQNTTALFSVSNTGSSRFIRLAGKRAIRR